MENIVESFLLIETDTSSRLWTGIYHFPLPSVCSVDLRGVLFINAGMSDCPASNQSGTGMNKNADAETSPVPA
jgi:hypothetical protein